MCKKKIGGGGGGGGGEGDWKSPQPVGMIPLLFLRFFPPSISALFVPSLLQMLIIFHALFPGCGWSGHL